MEKGTQRNRRRFFYSFSAVQLVIPEHCSVSSCGEDDTHCDDFPRVHCSTQHDLGLMQARHENFRMADTHDVSISLLHSPASNVLDLSHPFLMSELSFRGF